MNDWIDSQRVKKAQKKLSEEEVGVGGRKRRRIGEAEKSRIEEKKKKNVEKKKERKDEKIRSEEEGEEEKQKTEMNSE